MGLINPYIGMSRDDQGYYLDYDKAAASPYYQGSTTRQLLDAANQGGRVDLNDFNPYAGVTPAGSTANHVTGLTLGPDIFNSASDAKYKTPSMKNADIKYQGEQDVKRIEQEGRDSVQRAQMSSEIGMAQAATRRASEAAGGGTVQEDPGGPDVDLNTGGDTEDSVDDDGRGNTRRRRGAYQGAGLKI